MPSWAICISAGDPVDASLQRVTEDEARNRVTIQPIVLVGGEAERPFGEARFAQRLNEECQVFGVAKMLPVNPNGRKGSIIGRKSDASATAARASARRPART